MREIKFRAWNNKFKEFNFMSFINYLGARGIIDNWADGENSVWEQYTGLKDKNGDDIYENDIVKTLGANIYVVEFYDGKFNPVSDLEASDWEVIGNVHQNSDLLADDINRMMPDDIGNDIHEFLHGGDGTDKGLIRRPKYIEPLYTDDQLHPRVKMTQAEFYELEISLINAQFDYSELKKTIEIVPDMKWFVRSKEQYQPDMDQGISESGYLYLTQGNIYSIEYYETTTFKDDAQQFDTKEEADEWVTPVTEAVQLPVEDE